MIVHWISNHNVAMCQINVIMSNAKYKVWKKKKLQVVFVALNKLLVGFTLDKILAFDWEVDKVKIYFLEVSNYLIWKRYKLYIFNLPRIGRLRTSL